MVPDLLPRNASSAEVYQVLSAALANIGPITIEEKKTSLHVKGTGAAFLGVHPRKDGLRINIVLSRPLAGHRVVKADRVSANRFHNEVDLKQASDVDEELKLWLSEAYARAEPARVQA
jgi:hypothetical protein